MKTSGLRCFAVCGLSLKLLLAMVLAPRPALAQSGEALQPPSSESASPAPTSSGRSAAAEALFQQALALSERGELKQACEKLEASQTLDVAVGTLLYLADCYERTGRLASAWARFREAESLAQAQLMPERARMAGVRAEALEPKLSHVSVAVAADQPKSLAITLNGTPVVPVTWGTPLPVDAGALTLRATAPGYLPFERRLAVPAGERRELRVDVPVLRRAPSSVASREPSHAPETRPSASPFAIAASIVGVTGLAGAGVLALVATNKNGESKDYCPDSPNLCAARGVQLREDAGLFADLATASAIVGAASLATGVILFATSRRERPAVSVQISPAFGPRLAALHAEGRF